MTDRSSGRRIRVLRAIFLLALCNAAYLGYLRQHRFRYIIVHHTAGRVGDYRSIREFHRTNHDWIDAAYHLILSNGSTDVPEGYIEATSRYRTLGASPATRSGRHNAHGVHICVVGDYDVQEPSEIVRSSLANAIERLQRKFHIPTSRILLHRDCSSSRCPGRNITRDRIREWMAEGGGNLPEGVRAQHERVLAEAGLVAPVMSLFAGRILWFNACLFGLHLAFFSMRTVVRRKILRREEGSTHAR